MKNQLQIFIKRFKELSSLDDLTLDEAVILETLLLTINGLKENKKAEIKANKEARQ